MLVKPGTDRDAEKDVQEGSSRNTAKSGWIGIMQEMQFSRTERGFQDYLQ